MNGPIYIGNDGGIGLSSEGTNIGVGFTQINFASTNGTAIAITTWVVEADLILVLLQSRLHQVLRLVSLSLLAHNSQ